MKQMISNADARPEVQTHSVPHCEKWICKGANVEERALIEVERIGY